MNDLNVLRNEPYRFNLMLCRSANIPLQEAKFLRWVFLAERSSTDERLAWAWQTNYSGRGSWVTRWVNKV